MNLDKIYQLIEKYFDGRTTLEEEESLRSFFSEEGQEYPADLKRYQVLFERESEGEMYLDESFTVEIWENIQSEPNKSAPIIRPIFRWLTVAAASLIFVATAYQWNANRNNGIIIADPTVKEMTKREALLATKQTLAFVSNKLNKGRKPMKNIGTFYQIQNIVKKR